MSTHFIARLSYDVRRLGVLNAFSNNHVFSSHWLYWDVIPLQFRKIFAFENAVPLPSGCHGFDEKSAVIQKNVFFLVDIKCFSLTAFKMFLCLVY